MNDGEMLMQAKGELTVLDLISKAFIKNFPEAALAMLDSLKNQTYVRERTHQELAINDEQNHLITLLNRAYDQKISELILYANIQLTQKQSEDSPSGDIFLFSEKEQ